MGALAREDPSYHLARLTLLINAFSGSGDSLEGLTKLAKLDFLLRYPEFLDRLVERAGLEWPPDLAPSPPERLAVESRMMRYRYGPWDDRYYNLLGSLIGRGLVRTKETTRGRISFETSSLGRDMANAVAKDPEWQRTARRCDFLKQHFDRTGNELRRLIYDQLPDAVDRPVRQII